MLCLLCFNGRCYGHFYFYGRCYYHCLNWQIYLLQYIATMLWLMLLPCGRCYHHCCSYSCMLMADVIAMWQMEKPLFLWGWCYCPVADGMATAGCELPWLDVISRGADGRVILFQLELLELLYALFELMLLSMNISLIIWCLLSAL